MSQAIHLLDTSICIYIINKRPMDVFDRFEGLKVGQVAISSIMRAHGSLRSHFEGQGPPIGSMDMLIAAHALPWTSHG